MAKTTKDDLVSSPFNDAYKLFQQGGYNGSLMDFGNLLRTNDEAVKDAYTLFASGGYTGTIDDFQGLMNLPKKKSQVQSPSVAPVQAPVSPSPSSSPSVGGVPSQKTETTTTTKTSPGLGINLGGGLGMGASQKPYQLGINETRQTLNKRKELQESVSPLQKATADQMREFMALKGIDTESEEYKKMQEVRTMYDLDTKEFVMKSGVDANFYNQYKDVLNRMRAEDTLFDARVKKLGAGIGGDTKMKAIKIEEMVQEYLSKSAQQSKAIVDQYDAMGMGEYLEQTDKAVHDLEGIVDRINALNYYLEVLTKDGMPSDIHKREQIQAISEELNSVAQQYEQGAAALQQMRADNAELDSKIPLYVNNVIRYNNDVVRSNEAIENMPELKQRAAELQAGSAKEKSWAEIIGTMPVNIVKGAMGMIYKAALMPVVEVPAAFDDIFLPDKMTHAKKVREDARDFVNKGTSTERLNQGKIWLPDGTINWKDIPLTVADQIGVVAGLAAMSIGNPSASFGMKGVPATITSKGGQYVYRSAAKNMRSNMYSTVVPMAMATWGDRYDEALAEGKSAQEAMGYASVMSMLEGMSELIMPDARYFTGTLRKKLLSGYVDDLAKGGVEIAKKNLIGRYIKEVGTDAGKEWLEEMFMMGAESGYRGMQALQGDIGADEVLPSMDEFLMTTISTLLVGGVMSGGVGSIKTLNNEGALAKYELATHYNDAEGLILGNPKYSQEQKAEMLKNIRTFQAQLKVLPSDISKVKQAVAADILTEIKGLENQAAVYTKVGNKSLLTITEKKIKEQEAKLADVFDWTPEEEAKYIEETNKAIEEQLTKATATETKEEAVVEEGKLDTVADIERRRQEELEDLIFDDDAKLRLAKAKELGVGRYFRELKTQANKTEEGRILLDRYKAEDILLNPKSTLAERVTARAHLQNPAYAMNPAMVSDVQRYINEEFSTVGAGEGKAYWNNGTRELKKIYDAELAALEQQTKEEPNNANEKPVTEELPMGEQPEVSQGVREEDTQGEEVAKEVPEEGLQEIEAALGKFKKKEQPKEEAPAAEEVVVEEPKKETTTIDALKDVESTAKALEVLFQNNNNDYFEIATSVMKKIKRNTSSKDVAEAYHAAKKDGSNPELVSAVEELLSPKESVVVEKPKEEAPDTTTKEEKKEVVEKRNKKIDDWRNELKKDKRVLWHGSPSGDMKGSAVGLHIGTHEAAKQALESRIGVKADGTDWDGTEEYGKTLLAGKKTLAKEENKWKDTGYNAGKDIPEEDYYPSQRNEKAKYSDGTIVDEKSKPNIQPVRIKGGMTNSPQSPYEDFKANGYMRAAIKKGNAKNGYYYTNQGEDEGSISAVVPNKSHLEIITNPDFIEEYPKPSVVVEEAPKKDDTTNKKEEKGEAETQVIIDQKKELPLISTYNEDNGEIVLGQDIIDEIRLIENGAKDMDKDAFSNLWLSTTNKLWEEAGRKNKGRYKIFNQYFRSLIPDGELYSSPVLQEIINNTFKQRLLVDTPNIKIKALSGDVASKVDSQGKKILNEIVEFVTQIMPNKKLDIGIGNQLISVAGTDGFRMTIPNVDSPISDMFPYDAKLVIPAYQALEASGVDRRTLWAAHDFFHEMAHTEGVDIEREADKYAVEKVKEFAAWRKNNSSLESEVVAESPSKIEEAKAEIGAALEKIVSSRGWIKKATGEERESFREGMQLLIKGLTKYLIAKGEQLGQNLWNKVLEYLKENEVVVEDDILQEFKDQVLPPTPPKKAAKQSEVDKTTIQKVKDYATEVIEGRKEIRRLSQQAEEGRKQGGRRNVEATILLSRGGKESTKIEGREAQQQAVEDYAKQEGIWFDNIPSSIDVGEETILGTFMDEGQESQVFIPKDNPKIVRKAMRTTDPFNKDNPNEVLDFLDSRISEHNGTIGTKYTVVGFGRTSNGEFVVITEQTLIQKARLATRVEIATEMDQLGYEDTGTDTFSDENHYFVDVNPKNVLVDNNGMLHFIDTMIDILSPVNENGVDDFLNNTTVPKKEAKPVVESEDDGVGVSKQAERLLESNAPEELKEKASPFYEKMRLIESEDAAIKFVDEYLKSHTIAELVFEVNRATDFGRKATNPDIAVVMETQRRILKGINEAKAKKDKAAINKWKDLYGAIATTVKTVSVEAGQRLNVFKNYTEDLEQFGTPELMAENIKQRLLDNAILELIRDTGIGVKEWVNIGDKIGNIFNDEEFQKRVEEEVAKRMKKFKEEYEAQNKGKNGTSKKVGFSKETIKRLSKDGKDAATLIRSLKIPLDKSQLLEGTFVIPALVYNEVVEVVAKTIDLATDIAVAMANLGNVITDYIKKEHKDFFDSLTEEQQASLGESFVRKIEEEAIRAEETEKALVARLKEINKLNKLTDSQLKDVAAKSLREWKDKGMFDMPQFKEVLARVFSKPGFTEKDIKTLNQLIEVGNEYDAFAMDFMNNPNKWKSLQIQVFRHKAERVATKIDRMLQKENTMANIFRSRVQGNLLTAKSIARNIFAYPPTMIMRFSRDVLATAFDYSLASIGKSIGILKWLETHPNLRPWIARMLKGMLSPNITTNNFIKQAPFLMGMGIGLTKGMIELYTGVSSRNYARNEASSMLNSARSFASFAARLKGEKAKVAREMIKEAYEFMPFSLSAEMMFRLLNLGDKPFWTGAKMGALAELAIRMDGAEGFNLINFKDNNINFDGKKRKFIWDFVHTEGKSIDQASEEELNRFADNLMLDYEDRAAFLKKPSKYIDEYSREVASKYTYQAMPGMKIGGLKLKWNKTVKSSIDAAMNKLVQSAEDKIKDAKKRGETPSNIGISLLKAMRGITSAVSTVLFPYEMTPINLSVEAAKYTMPALNFGIATVHAVGGNRKAAIHYAAQGFVTMAFKAAIINLIQKAIIVVPIGGGDDDEERDTKVRSNRYMNELMQFGYINKTLLQEHLAGKPLREGKDTDVYGSILVYGSIGYAIMVIAKTFENKEIKNKEQEQFDKLANIFDLETSMALGGTFIKQTMLKSAYGLTLALAGGPNEWNEFMENSYNVLVSSTMPNTLQQAKLGMQSDYRFRTIRGQRLKGALALDFGDLESIEGTTNYVIDLAGRKVESAPKGFNKWENMTIGFDNPRHRTNDTVLTPLYDAYEQAIKEYGNKEAKDIIIPTVGTSFNVKYVDEKGREQSVAVKLQNHQDLYAEYVGRARYENMATYIINGTFAGDSFDERVKKLSSIYRKGQQDGRDAFIANHSDILIDLIKNQTGDIPTLKEKNSSNSSGISVGFKFPAFKSPKF